MRGRFGDRESASVRGFDALHVRIAISALAAVLLACAALVGAWLG